MASILPTKIQDLVNFCNAHVEPWVSSRTSIGLSSAQTTAFQTAAQDLNAAFIAKADADEAARIATANLRVAVTAARRIGGDNIRIIKAFAEASANPQNVYNLAQIPAPMPPGTMAPPGQPYDFRATLESNGSITLRFKCNNPAGAAGTVYQVRRKLGTQSAFEFIGAVGTREFTDVTLPAGQASVQYTVTGQRGQSVGPASAPFTLLFGHGGGQMSIESQFSGNESTLKLGGQSNKAAA